jgi:membrane-associated phospholipid phosphatase
MDPRECVHVKGDCDPLYAMPITEGYSPAARWDPAMLPDEGCARFFPPAWYTSKLCEGDWRPIAPHAEFRTLFEMRSRLRETRSAEILREADANFNLPRSFKRAVLEALELAGRPSSEGAAMPLLDICKAAMEAVHQVVMRQKKLYNRARPYQVFPEIDPMFCPGHPSYPSGHATESMTIALLLSAAMTRRGDPYEVPRQSALATARRIGENREVAGVHFPSDSAAGHTLADNCVAYLRAELPFAPRFRRLKDAFDPL